MLTLFRKSLPNLETLRSDMKFTNDIAQSIAEYCAKLKHLEIRGSQKKWTIEPIFKKCKLLQSVSCIDENDAIYYVDNESIVALAENAANISSLQLTYLDTKCSSSSLANLIANCPKLDRLKLEYTPLFEDTMQCSQVFSALQLLNKQFSFLSMNFVPHAQRLSFVQLMKEGCHAELSYQSM